MITFFLNGREVRYNGDGEESLLHYLREREGITSVKDGCSGQAACGACLVEIDGKARLSCTRRMRSLEGSQVVTLEGVPAAVRDAIAEEFVARGAVQCGFCTPGLIMRTKILFEEWGDPVRVQDPVRVGDPVRVRIRHALKLHLCRCTGYVKIIDAIEAALKTLEHPDLREKATPSGTEFVNTGAGHSLPKYTATEAAIGKRPFIDDLRFPGMVHGALRFSDHPRAVVRTINTNAALAMPGVIRVFTAADVPGDRYTGLIISDWPLMIDPGETTRYIGDVIAGVVAVDEATARRAAAAIEVAYDVLEPVTDPQKAISIYSPTVHPDRPNLLDTCIVKRGGDAAEILAGSAFTASGIYETQRIEHAFLEPEAAVAMPEGDGLRLYSQGQGIYVDQRQVATLLGIGEERVHITLVPCGGGFGGREDLTVQGHAALFAWLLRQPVKVKLSREESIRMHPKRHPVRMEIAMGCDEKGMLTALTLRAVGDTGAYASVGAKVLERVAGHATGAYHVPAVDIEALTVYTNNIPSGAMRGFGANQAAFALEGCIDELCRLGGFDRWQFRYDNALDDGKMTATGQVLGKGVGVKACLEALKESFYTSKTAGLACGIKNSGVGNGMVDFSDVRISIGREGRVLIEHGWTEMGQGIHNMAIQTLCQETGIDASMVDVIVDTSAGLPTGMTTSSRATALLGNAIIDACEALRADLDQFTPGCLDLQGRAMRHAMQQMAGRSYLGKYYCDWTTKPGAATEKIITHYSYGYAAQLVVLDDSGAIEKVVAAHDAGRIMNPLMFEGQIEGAVHMGLGYALTEDLPMLDGKLVSTKLADCGVLRAHETPIIEVIGVEVADPVGPYGAKGIGEIGLVPTAAAVANALCLYDGIRRYRLPMKRGR